jgi:hypothetical protein
MLGSQVPRSKMCLRHAKHDLDMLARIKGVVLDSDSRIRRLE